MSIADIKRKWRDISFMSCTKCGRVTPQVFVMSVTVKDKHKKERDIYFWECLYCHSLNEYPF